MNQTVDLGTVLGNTASNLSWTGFTLMCAIILVGILWCILPFAVFGVKRRLDAIENAQRQQTELLIGELRRTNELLARRTAGTQPVQQAEPAWDNTAPSTLFPDDLDQRAPVAANFRAPRQPAPAPHNSAPGHPAPGLAGMAPARGQSEYVPYPDDPRPVERDRLERDRWARGARRFARGGNA